MVYGRFSRRLEIGQRFLLPVVILSLGLLFWWAYVRPFDGSVPAVLTAPVVNRSAFSFIPNAGQSDAAVRYMAHGQGMGLFFTDEGLTFSGGDGTVRWQFGGAKTAEIQGADVLPGVANFLYGPDAARWQTGLPTYGAVMYEGLYPGVDGVFNGRGGQLEAVFRLEPGAVPAVLQWRFRGLTARLKGETGGLELVNDDGGVVFDFERPLAQVQTGGETKPVAADFTIDEDGIVAPAVGAYDPAYPLSIVLTASLGGGTPTGIDHALDVVSNAALETFVTGYTSSRVFPVVTPLQGDIAGETDVFVTKFSADGEVLFSTFLGGSSLDYGEGVDVDSAGNVIVTGYTFSFDFPLANPIMGNQPESDVFVSKISADGSQLLFSTYLGGGGIDSSDDVVVDNQDNMYVTGITVSSDFPLLNPIQASYGGGYGDAFLSQISGGSYQLMFSTFLGGNNLDWGAGIGLDQNGDVFVAGSTASINFPVANTGIARPQTGPNDQNVFVAKVAANGSNLLFSALFGGGNVDNGGAVSVDPLGNAFVVGYTESLDFPVVSPIQAVNRGTRDAFVTRVAGDGSSLLFSTYLGGNLEDSGMGIVAGEGGNVFVTGRTWSNDFPLLNPLPGMGYPGGGDAFVLRHSMDGALVWSTYLGGSYYDVGEAIDVDDLGRPVVVGATDSQDFPTANAFQEALHGAPDAFVGRLNHLGTSLQFSTYLGGDNGYPGDPTDVAVSGIGGTAEPKPLIYLVATGLLVLLFIGVWRINRRRFQ